jgi:hypothetical protein
MSAIAVETEDDASLQDRRRVVEVQDRRARTSQRLERPLDERFPALGEHLDDDVVGDVVALDQLADEVEVSLAR